MSMRLVESTATLLRSLTDWRSASEAATASGLTVSAIQKSLANLLTANYVEREHVTPADPRHRYYRYRRTDAGRVALEAKRKTRANALPAVTIQHVTGHPWLDLGADARPDWNKL